MTIVPSQVVITLRAGVAAVEDKPADAQVLIIDFDQFIAGAASLTLPRTKVEGGVYDWLQARVPKWFQSQMALEAILVQTVSLEAQKQLRTQHAVRYAIEHNCLRPTDLSRCLGCLPYRTVMDALGTFLDRGAVILRPDRYLVWVGGAEPPV